VFRRVKESQLLVAVRHLITCFAVTVLALGPVIVSAQADVEARHYTLWYRNYDNPATYALVKLALQKTPEYGEFAIHRSQELTQGRALRELATNSRSIPLDIANVATTVERETALNTVPVPVDGGLLGLRVCLVLPENVDRFSEIDNIRDLRASDIRIGQGAHWPDSSILKANGVPVITHTRYEILFRMLRNDRFDCFARGVSEVLYDQRVQNAEDLVIEPHLLLAYPMPSYLFTSPEDHATAQRLQLGLERAIEDGSFGNYLKTWYSRPVAELQLNKRAIIRLSNPFLSEESRNIGRRVLKNLDRRIDLLTAPQ
jgi:hypothetical protein